MTLRPAVLLALALGALSPFPARAAEVCHYTGSGSQSGQLAVDTVASTVNGERTVSVASRIEGRYLGIFRFQYLHQEVTVWRDGELRQLGVNHRYTLNGSVRRQQWDVFTRTPEGMVARRAQAKTLADLQAHHPGFARFWSPATFGQPWLATYDTAGAERRADLDLPAAAMPRGTGTPLAMGFHWIRWSEANGGTAPLFLAGFKDDPRLDVPVTLIGTEPDGTRHLRATVRHPKLNPGVPSFGDAWVSPDHRLTRVVFEGHGRKGTVRGEVRLDRCEGDVRTP